MSSPVRIKYYDQEGNFSHEETGAEKLSKMFLKRSFVSQPESKIKTMALMSEIYAEKHDGQYPLSAPKEKYQGFIKCGATAYGYKYQCTNTIDGYEYKATAVDTDSNGKIKVFTVKTGEIFTKSEL